MEPVTTFILSTASGIIANVISKMITSRKASIQKEELEKEVALSLVRRGSLVPGDPSALARAIMREIELISSRHPDLSVTAELIGLRKLPRRGPFAKKTYEESISERLKALDEVVAQRRQEILHEPSMQDHQESHVQPSDVGAPISKVVDSRTEALVEWGAFPEPPKALPKDRLSEMMRRVERRRSEEASDD